MHYKLVDLATKIRIKYLLKIQNKQKSGGKTWARFPNPTQPKLSWNHSHQSRLLQTPKLQDFFCQTGISSQLQTPPKPSGAPRNEPPSDLPLFLAGWRAPHQPGRRRASWTCNGNYGNALPGLGTPKIPAEIPGFSAALAAADRVYKAKPQSSPLVTKKKKLSEHPVCVWQRIPERSPARSQGAGNKM